MPCNHFSAAASFYREYPLFRVLWLTVLLILSTGATSILFQVMFCPYAQATHYAYFIGKGNAQSDQNLAELRLEVRFIFDERASDGKGRQCARKQIQKKNNAAIPLDPGLKIGSPKPGYPKCHRRAPRLLSHAGYITPFGGKVGSITLRNRARRRFPGIMLRHQSRLLPGSIITRIFHGLR